MLSTELAALFARDLKRLTQELTAFPNSASLWRTVPGVTNTAGTLALHLEGNLREYIGRQLGGVEYARDRPLEFSRRGVEQQLAAVYPEQVLGTPITTRQFAIHLSGHLNYHLGQIDYLRRFITGNGAIDLARS
jgi:hypothetical protein